MTHEEAVRLLTDYAAGRLSPSEREEVARHVDTCAECGGLMETIQILSAPPRKKDADRGPPPHPASAEIVDYALDPGTLAAPRRESLAAHVRGCDRCARDVEHVLQAEKDDHTAPATAVAGRDAAPPSRRRLLPQLALAAAAIGAAGMSWLGFDRLPRLQARIDALEAERRPGLAATTGSEPRTGTVASPDAAGGFARIFVLPDSRRSSDAPLTLDLNEGERTLYVSFEAQRLAEAPDQHLRFGLTDPGGAVVWSMESTTDEVRAQLGGSRELTLAIPAQPLPAGRLTLTVSSPGDALGPLLVRSFVLRRAAPESQ